MNHRVYCLKLQKEAEGLAYQPLPGEFGKKIHEHISAEAWQTWLNHQTMLINEYRLNLIDPEARAFLLKEADNFLFGTGSDKPAGYTPK